MCSHTFLQTQQQQQQHHQKYSCKLCHRVNGESDRKSLKHRTLQMNVSAIEIRGTGMSEPKLKGEKIKWSIESGRNLCTPKRRKLFLS